MMDKDDLRYLLKLANWAACEGFSFEDMPDADDWLYTKWRSFNAEPEGAEYDTDRLADLMMP